MSVGVETCQRHPERSPGAIGVGDAAETVETTTRVDLVDEVRWLMQHLNFEVSLVLLELEFTHFVLLELEFTHLVLL